MSLWMAPFSLASYHRFVVLTHASCCVFQHVAGPTIHACVHCSVYQTAVAVHTTLGLFLARTAKHPTCPRTRTVFCACLYGLKLTSVDGIETVLRLQLAIRYPVRDHSCGGFQGDTSEQRIPLSRAACQPGPVQCSTCLPACPACLLPCSLKLPTVMFQGARHRVCYAMLRDGVGYVIGALSGAWLVYARANVSCNNRR